MVRGIICFYSYVLDLHGLMRAFSCAERRDIIVSCGGVLGGAMEVADFAGLSLAYWFGYGRDDVCSMSTREQNASSTFKFTRSGQE
jgi:hypothetical protein